MNRQPSQGMSFHERSMLALNAAAACSAPLRNALSVFGTVGWRQAAGPLVWVGLALMFIWGVMSRSDVLAYVLAPGAFLLTLAQVATAKRDGTVHSHEIGRSILAKGFADPRQGRYVDAGLAILAGVLARDQDFGLGTWLIAAGVSQAIVSQWIARRDRHLRADLSDALQDARNRSGSVDRPPLF